MLGTQGALDAAQGPVVGLLELANLLEGGFLFGVNVLEALVVPAQLIQLGQGGVALLADLSGHLFSLPEAAPKGIQLSVGIGAGLGDRGRGPGMSETFGFDGEGPFAGV